MKKKAIYLLDMDKFDYIYGPQERAEIETMVDIIAKPQTKEGIFNSLSILKDVEVIFSSWGMIELNNDFLKLAPNLQAVFYSAGSIRYFMTDAAFDRNIIVTSSYAASAIPVGEYCCGAIMLGLKQALFFSRRLNREGKKAWVKNDIHVPGAYKSTVGLVSLGMVGKHVLKLLKNFDVKILVYSQSMTKKQAIDEGVESVSLKELFKRSDAISIHTANLPETQGMITGELINSMKQNSTLINTARGAVIEEKNMIEVLKRRQDITAILDVTDPEPPIKDSPLYTLSNIFLTPHIAGPLETECRRMAQYSINECRKWLNGGPMSYLIDKKTFERMA